MKRLIIKFKDGTQVSFVIADYFSKEQALEAFKSSYSGPLKEITFYGFEVETEKEKNDLFFIKLKNDKALEIRKIRDFFLKSLDVPFMMAIEEDNKDFKDYIISLKSFLRDVPKNSRLKEINDPNEIFRYNPFNNIFRIELTNQGDGYEEPPTVTVEPPSGPYFGYQAKAIAFLENKKISRVEVIDEGCGYVSLPKVTISAPPSGITAEAVCLSIENGI